MRQTDQLSSCANRLNLFDWPIPSLVAALLLISSQFSHPLFHTLSGLACIGIGMMMALTAWHTRHLVGHSIFLYLGYSYFWIALLDLSHTLAFPALSIFPSSLPQLSSQLGWAARFTEALVLLTIPLFIHRTISSSFAFLTLGLSTLILWFLIFSNHLFTAIDTTVSASASALLGNYGLIPMLAVAALLLKQQKPAVAPHIYRYLQPAVLLTLLSELCLSLSSQNQDLFNIASHLLSFVSYWLLFLATVRHTLERPFAQMARDASTYDAIPYATIIVDNNNLIRQANLATQRMLERPRNTIVGQQAHQLFHDPRLPPAQCKICNAVQLHQQSLHQTVEHAPGCWYEISTYPISNGHIVTATVQVIHDVSDKVASNASNSRLTTLIEQAPDLIAICNPNGELQYLNPAGRELLRVDAQTKLSSINLFQQCHHLTQQQTIEAVISLSRLLGNSSDECELISRTGSSIPVYFTLIAHHDHQHRVDYFSFIAHDISLQRQQEKILRHTQKMEALGQVTSGIAHDFNNILSVILGYSQILNKRLIGQEQLQSYSNEIYRASERGSRLTQQLLAFSRQTDHQQQLENVNGIIKDMLPLLAQALGRHIIIHTQLETSLWPTSVNRGEFEDTLLNLAINAMHAMPDGGNLFIQSENRLVQGNRPEEAGMVAGNYVAISLRDTGSGIDESILPKIFEPFFSTKKHQGTGLGLSQTFGFMKRCQGEVRVHSKLGVGTTFTLYFPRSNYISSQAGKLPEIDADYSAMQNETVLVVDAESTICRLLKNILAAESYRVLTANSASQARQLLHHHKVDLLLSDILLPVEDGIKLAQYCAQHHPYTAILLLAGHQQYDQNNQPAIPKDTAILGKPFTPKILLKQIRFQLENQRTVQPEAQPA